MRYTVGVPTSSGQCGILLGSVATPEVNRAGYVPTSIVSSSSCPGANVLTWPQLLHCWPSWSRSSCVRQTQRLFPWRTGTRSWRYCCIAEAGVQLHLFTQSSLQIRDRDSSPQFLFLSSSSSGRISRLFHYFLLIHYSTMFQTSNFEF